MSGDEPGFVRGFGSLADGIGGIAWNLAGGGGVALADGEVTATSAGASPANGGESKGWAYRAEWSADPLQGAGVFRHLAIEEEGGASILVSSTGAPGIEGHGMERTEATLLTAEGGAPYDEALLSTQYDRDGRPTRIGIELWTGEDVPPTRVAGSLIGGAVSGEVWAGFFRCHTDGAERLGAYLLWRA